MGPGSEEPLDTSDIECLTVTAEGLRLAARIVDTPCGEMHVDAFLEASPVVSFQSTLVLRILLIEIFVGVEESWRGP